jgi:hypothetical protein
MNNGERTGDMAEEQKPKQEQELKEKIRQALLKNCDAVDSDEIDFLLKRL